MDLSPIIELLPQPMRAPAAVLASLAGVGAAWWVGGRLTWRKDEREASDAVWTRMNKLLAEEAARGQRQAALCEELGRQVETLRAGRFALQEFVAQLQDGLIAARTMLHEAERQLGRPETVFPPLPPMPLSTMSARDPGR